MPWPRKQPEPIAISLCAWCRGEIYVGDGVKRVDGEADVFVHDDWSGTGTNCAAEYASERVYDAEGTINERKEIE